jgi:hypothetical protein
VDASGAGEVKGSLAPGATLSGASDRALAWLYAALAGAGLIDLLVGRLLLRVAVFVPKSAAVAAVFRAVGTAGQFAFTLASVLAILALAVLAWRAFRHQRLRALPAAVALLLALHLALLLQPADARLLPGYHLAMLWVLASLGGLLREPGAGAAAWPAGACVLGVMVCGEMHQMLPALYRLFAWTGPPPTGAVFNLGEALLVVAAAGLWWSEGRGAPRGVWLLAAVPALVFTVLRLANPAMTGVLAIWSVGLTLYLPWPCYSLALWLGAVAGLRAWTNGRPARWAVPLLLAGGYAPQLSVHAFIGLVALWLLVRPDGGVPAGGRGARRQP